MVLQMIGFPPLQRPNSIPLHMCVYVCMCVYISHIFFIHLSFDRFDNFFQGMCPFYPSCQIYWHKVAYGIFLLSFSVGRISSDVPLSFLILIICVLSLFLGQFS